MVNIRISIAPDVLGLKTKTILLIASLHVALRCLGAKAIIHETKIFKWQSVLSIVLWQDSLRFLLQGSMSLWSWVVRMESSPRDRFYHVTSQRSTLHHHHRRHGNTTSHHQNTTAKRNGRKLAHTKNSVWAARWLVALRTFYGQSLSLAQKFLPPLKLLPPVCPSTSGKHTDM